MTTNQFWTAVEKAKKVIDSCVTDEQFKRACNYCYFILNREMPRKMRLKASGQFIKRMRKKEKQLEDSSHD